MTQTAPRSRVEGLACRRDFSAVQEQGTRASTRFAVIHWLPRAEQPAYRLGLMARRTMAGAVARNRAKRQMREVFRRCAPPPPPAADAIIVMKKEIFKAEYREIEAEIKKFLGKKASC